MENWMKECRALVQHEAVWALLSAEWPWQEAWETDLSPAQAVHFALVDVLAPLIGEVTL